jgi:hypothetical protein
MFSNNNTNKGNRYVIQDAKGILNMYLGIGVLIIIEAFLVVLLFSMLRV